jgi:flagellar basal-body rod protein FlgB
MPLSSSPLTTSSSLPSALPDLFGGNISVLSATLNGLSKRHDAISSNVANATTPGYQKRSVDFEGTLGQALQAQQRQKQHQLEAAEQDNNDFQQSREQHLTIDKSSSSPEASSSQPGQSLERLQFETRLEPGDVEMEQEMAQLARNSQKYVAISRLTFKAFDGLKSILKSTGS